MLRVLFVVWVLCHTNTFSCDQPRDWKAGRVLLTLLFSVPPQPVFIASQFVFLFSYYRDKLIMGCIGGALKHKGLRIMNWKTTSNVEASVCMVVGPLFCILNVLPCSWSMVYSPLVRVIVSYSDYFPQQHIYLFCIFICKERTWYTSHSSLRKLPVLSRYDTFTC